MANELPGLSGAIRRFTATAAITVGAAALIAGCAAGQSAQTVNQRPPIDGASTDAGAISIRTAAIAPNDAGTAYPKGSNAPLHLVIVNNGPDQVQLQSVSSPAATSAQVSSAGASQSSSSGPSGSASSSDTASATGSSSASASGTATGSSASGSRSASGTGSTSASRSGAASASNSASPSESASPSGTAANTPITISPGQPVQIGFGSDGPTISLVGLTSDLYPAQTVPVTFTFSDGSTVTLAIPVAVPSNAPSAPVVSDATEPTEPNG